MLWIDRFHRKKIDDEKHMRKYTPRKVKSNWSANNKTRAAKLMKKGLMTEFGLNSVEIAKQNGSWNKLDSVDIRIKTPKALKDSLT